MKAVKIGTMILEEPSSLLRRKLNQVRWKKRAFYDPFIECYWPFIPSEEPTPLKFDPILNVWWPIVPE